MNSKVKEQNTKGSISYTGNVKVSVVRDGKVIKKRRGRNSGKLPLFSFLTNCLIGAYNDKLRPRFIKLFNDSDEEISYSYIPFSEINVDSTAADATTVSSTAIFKFLVPFSALKQGEKVKIIRIYNSDSEEMAVYELSEADEITIEINESIIIEWDMVISDSHQS